MEPITWPALATAAGASVIAGVLVQFIKIFKEDLSPTASRQLSAVLGVVVVLVAVTILNETKGVAEYLLGLLVGVQAGLAASKTVEVATRGLNHRVVRS